MKPTFVNLIALLLTSVAALHAADTPAPPVKPNILWIVMDDVGVELPCYGEKAIQTPNIDRLAREGTKFTGALLTSPVCSTARSAMITGMYQTTLGANNHVSGRGPRRIDLPAGVEPAPAIFQRAGYHTCNGDYPGKSKGIGKTDYNFEWDHKMYDGNDWAGRKPGRPFFAQVQLWGGKNRNDDGRWYRNEALKALGTLTKPEEVSLPPYYPRDPVLLEDWVQYLDSIRFSDKKVGEILQRLESEGILDQTIIILMGDNGISHARGKQFLYDEGIRTPFIVRGPGIPRGAVRTDLIEHIDMAATSLAWAGIKVPEWMQGRDIFSPDYRKRDAVFAARDRCGETVDRIRSVRTEQFKYIRNFYPERPLLQPSNYKDTKLIIIRLRELHATGKLNALQEELLFAPSRPPEELYDVQKDPFETVNLAGNSEYVATLAELRARLEQWSRDTSDPAPESAETYDLEMQAQVARTKDPTEKANVKENIALMKQWATERPLRKDKASGIAPPSPTHARVSYGKDPAQFVDVYLAKADKPTPAIIYIHGGAWNRGSAEGMTRTDVFGADNKRGEGVQVVLNQGISVVSVEYRFITAALKAGAKPPVEWPLRDAARALQFVRSKAKEWNIDPQRIGLTGSSAGGCSSLWLAMHPDMANPRSADFVARESTRVACVGVLNAQSSLDPLELTGWFKEARYGAHAFGFFGDSKHSVENMAACLAARDELLPWIQEFSPIAWASADDPPVFLGYLHAPEPAGQPQLDSVHGAAHGVKLKETLDQLGVECHLAYPGKPHPQYRDHIGFLIRKLKPSKTSN